MTSNYNIGKASFFNVTHRLLADRSSNIKVIYILYLFAPMVIIDWKRAFIVAQTNTLTHRTTLHAASCFLLSIRQDFYVFLQHNQKRIFFAHFNFAVFWLRPRNREIFIPRNFHAIKYNNNINKNRISCAKIFSPLYDSIIPL